MDAKPKRTYFRLKDDVSLLRSTLARDPYANKEKWESVRNDISDDTFNPSSRTVKERVDLLVRNYKREDRLRRARSGTEEEYDELDRMLQEITSLKEDAEQRKTNEKKQIQDKKDEDDKKVAMILQKSMETIGKRKEPTAPSTTTSASTNTSTSASTSASISTSTSASTNTSTSASTSASISTSTSASTSTSTSVGTSSSSSSTPAKRRRGTSNFLEDYLLRKIELEERRLAFEEKKYNDSKLKQGH